jgi:hypothetical protein
MKKHIKDFPFGNPQFKPMTLDSRLGLLVVRRNHRTVDRKGEQCNGLNVWLNGQYLGAIGSRTLSELSTMSEEELKSATFPACCGKHKDFDFGTKSNRGGARPGAGRPIRGEQKRLRISAMLDPKTIAYLDQKRGEFSRSEFLDQIIAERAKRKR